MQKAASQISSCQLDQASPAGESYNAFVMQRPPTAAYMRQALKWRVLLSSSLEHPRFSHSWGKISATEVWAGVPAKNPVDAPLVIIPTGCCHAHTLMRALQSGLAAVHKRT